MKDQSLHTLMLQAGDGDTIAFRQLAQRLGQRLFRLAMNLLNNNRAAAEDCVQECLIKLWTIAPRWQENGSVEAYAARILHNCCMDLYRRTKPTSELNDEIGDSADTAFEHLEGKEKRTYLYQAINKLSERQRQAILLFYMEDRPAKEIAVLMKTTPKSVERLLARGRENLAGALPDSLKIKGSA